MKSIKEEIVTHFGREAYDGTMASHEALIRECFELIKPKVLLEIGTLRGLSAALFARLGMKVITVDIQDDPLRIKVWEYLKVVDNIRAIIISSNLEKKIQIETCQFDFAFIDADHSYSGVAFDFECTRACGALLFHDYKPMDKKFKGLVRFLDSLKPSVYTFGPEQSRFAIWLADDSPFRSNAKFMQWLNKKNQSKCYDFIFNRFRPYFKN